MEVKQRVTNKLESAFLRYIEVVLSKLKIENREARIKGSLKLLKNRALEIQALVNEAEEQSEFDELVKETLSAYSTDGFWWEALLKDAIQNFFRRTKCYLAIYNAEDFDAEISFKNYIDTFEEVICRCPSKRTFLAPIELIGFAEDVLDFDTFQIRRFSSKELADLLKNDINKIFYEYAFVDVERLTDYWFIQITEPIAPPIFSLNEIYIELPSPIIERSFTTFPKPLERVLQLVTLYDWQSWLIDGLPDQERGWLRFNIPFILEINDNSLSLPNAAPNLPELPMKPDVTPEGEEYWMLDMEYIDNAESDSFKAFIRNSSTLRANLSSTRSEWPFLDIALGYFIKAFFAEGLEQLLWHITVLEALLGEEGQGATKRLARRLASILVDHTVKQTLEEQFKNLYKARCDLVHGNNLAEDIYRGHLREARELARRLLLWFLQYLNVIQTEFASNRPGEQLPDRGQLLKIIDLDKSSNVRKEIITKLPRGFPYVPDWSDI